MTTTKNNEHKKLNFSSEREQNQACLNSAEHEKNQGRKVLNVPNKREQNQTCLDSAEREGLRPKGNVPNLRFKEFQGEWEKCKLSEICTFFSGGTPSSSNKDFYGGNIAFIRSGELHADSTELFITQAGFDSSSAKMVEVGDLLLAMYGATSGDIAVSKIKGAINQAILCIRTKQNKKFIESIWNKHVSKNLRKYLQGGQGNLSADIVKGISFFFPTLKEQEKIANLVSLLDERIATQNKIIEDLKKLKSAISKKLLCNDKWTTYKIQDIAEIGRGRVISSVEIDRQKHPLYPVYSSQTSNNGIMGYLDNYMFDGEYITWTTDGANAGTVFYRKGKFNCTNVCGTLKILPKFDCYFVSLVLQQATQKYVSSNLANPKLMNNTMASIKIRMPNIETQKQLSKVFQTLDSCLLVHQRTCKMYLSEKQYLLRQMFI